MTGNICRSHFFMDFVPASVGDSFKYLLFINTMLTRPYYLDPLTSHFNIVKLGVHIIVFLFLL